MDTSSQSRVIHLSSLGMLTYSEESPALEQDMSFSKLLILSKPPGISISTSSDSSEMEPFESAVMAAEVRPELVVQIFFAFFKA